MSNVRWFFVLLFFYISNSYAFTFEIDSPDFLLEEYEPFEGLPISSKFEVNIIIPKEFENISKITDYYELVISSISKENWVLSDGNNQLPFELKVVGDYPYIFDGIKVKKPLNIHDFIKDSKVIKGDSFVVDSYILKSEFMLFVPPSIFAIPGKYTFNMQMDFINSLTNEYEAPSEIMNMSVIVKPKIQVNIAKKRSKYQDGNSIITVDFGELKSGKKETVYLQIRGNTDANINISSENNGKLKNNNLFIDYSINLDGHSSSLTQPIVIKRTVPKNMEGDNYPMDIIIGDVKRSFAGKYKDIINIDVTPSY